MIAEFEQVYRNLFFLNFILLRKPLRECRRKKYCRIIIEYANFDTI